MKGITVKRFDAPDEKRTFTRGSFDILEAGGMTLGRARYEPGWKWSVHVGPEAGTALCEVDHVGIVVSGRAMVKMRDGTEVELRAGDCFAVGPGHDSWVVGDEPYVSLHLLGAGDYARKVDR